MPPTALLAMAFLWHVSGRLPRMLLCLAGFSCLLTAPVSAARVALVIGNGGYAADKLPNPPNDAALVAKGLAQAGFQVIQKTDLGREGMTTAVREFSDALKPGDVALFFYAGHGMQVKGENFLVPVDAPQGMKEYEAEHRSVSAGLVLDAMAESRSQLNIVILDCCRDNPFARGWRSNTKGLAEMKAPQETVICYATAPGTAASDGEGSNSPYSQALAQELLRPGLKLEEVFKNVARRVFETTKGAQRPWISLDVLGDFAFVEGTRAPMVPAPSVPAPAVVTPSAPPTVKPAPTAPQPATAKKPVRWSKGILQAELVSLTQQSDVQASVVMKVTNTSKDKVLKVGYDWLRPEVQYFSVASPQGSDLFTAAGAHLKCVSASGIECAIFPNGYSVYDGMFGGPREIIDGVTEIGPQESVTLSIDYGLTKKTDGGNGPSSQSRTGANHQLGVSLWFSEVFQRGFGKPARATVQFENIPPSP
ncbi:caspase family protein [Prosthecobacter sp.]|uniref:caspase family protein n=1 Tax=Prosthecobacter sp. TaxID=1965333 RepID=UPI0037836510